MATTNLDVQLEKEEKEDVGKNSTSVSRHVRISERQLFKMKKEEKEIQKQLKLLKKMQKTKEAQLEAAQQGSSSTKSSKKKKMTEMADTLDENPQDFKYNY